MALTTSSWPMETHKTGAAPLPRRPRGLGVISGALFALALFTAPFAAAALLAGMAQGGAFTFTATPAAADATLRALNTQSHALVAAANDAQRAWNDMVARELAEGDRAAARGLMLAAGPMVGGPAREAHRLRLAGQEELALRAALALLTPDIAAQAEAEGLISVRPAETPPAMGDARDLALQARNWLEGRGQSVQDLLLTGILVTTPDVANRLGLDPLALHAGAATLKAALRAGRLDPAFQAALNAVLADVNQEDALAQRLRAALSSQAALADEPAAVRAAFLAAASDTPAWRNATGLMLEAAGLTRAVGTQGAARLLAHAATLDDLDRLQLIADASGDQAVALAKRQSEPGLLIQAARADIAWSSRLLIAAGVLLACLLIISATPLITVAHAISGAWHAPAHKRTGKAETNRPPHENANTAHRGKRAA